MIFNSFTYLIFLLLFTTLFWILNNKFRKYLIFVSSLVFYSFWRFDFLLLLFITILINFISAIKIDNNLENKYKKKYFFFSLFCNIFLIIFFKYTYFIIDTVNVFVPSNNIFIISFKIILPLGISFYTFQSISYIVDIYNKRCQAEKNFINFANYLIFFPQLIAGPIVRSSELIWQLKENKKLNLLNLNIGIKKIFIGLFIKLFLADNIAFFLDEAFNQDYKYYSNLDTLTLAYAYGFQIYFDFAGYSLIAIGSANLVGVHLPENFNFPYLSKNPKEFWTRWHISLSSWIRDYLYLPLIKQKTLNFSTGGFVDLNSKQKISSGISLLATWIVMGLWHGANWSFVIWGLYHALLILIWRFFDKFYKSLNNNLLLLIIYLSNLTLIMLSWIPFKTQNLEKTFSMWSNLFSIEKWLYLSLKENTYLYTFLIFIGIFFSRFIYNKILLINIKINSIKNFFVKCFQLIFWVLIVIIVFGHMKQTNLFIYFQF